MRRALFIAKREYLASVRTKGFIVGLVIGPFLMFGSLIAMVGLRGQVDVKDQRVAIVDRSGKMAESLVQSAAKRNQQEVYNAKTGKKVKPSYVLEPVSAGTGDSAELRLRLSEQVRQGELHAFLEIGPDVVSPGTNQESAHISYHAKSAALDDLRRWLEQPVNEQLRRLRLKAAGIDDSRATNLFLWTGVEGMGLVSKDAQTGKVQEAKHSGEFEAVGTPLIAMMMLWVIVMMGGMPLLGAVMEEKGLRIAEVLLGCATPFELMLGKLIGSVGIALTGSLFYIGSIGVALLQMGMFGYFPLTLLPWFLIYAVAAILTVGAISISLGSACADAKDAQTMGILPLLPVLIPMFMIGPLLKEPNSTFAVATSLFPPFTPMIMLMRQSMPGGVSGWQPWVGLVGILCFTWLMVFGGSRIFRVGIIMQGKAPKLGEILRWALRG